MRRRDFLALGAMSLAACRQRHPASVVVATKLSALAAPVLLTQELGYFADEGLQVDIRQLDGSSEGIPLLASGRVDVAFYGLSLALLNAILGGARVRVVAGRHRYTTSCDEGSGLLGSRRAFPDGFSDLHQLKGRRASLASLSSHSAYVLDAALSAAALSRDDIAVVVNPENRGTALLATGEVDVVVAVDPIRLQRPALLERIVVGPAISTFLPGRANSFVVFGSRMLDGDPSVATRFLRALRRGSRAFVDGRTPRFLEDLARDNGHGPEEVRRGCRRGFIVDGRFRLDDVQGFIDWGVARGFTRPMRADEVVDLRFLNRLNALAAPAAPGRS